MTPKRILCPTDFADGDDRVIGIAIGLAESSGAELLLLHVVEDPAEQVYGEKSTEGKDRAAWALWKHAKQDIEDRLAKLLPEEAVTGRGARVLCAFGDPAERITETIEKEGVDLVILCGRRRKTLLQGAQLGHVSYRVVRAAACDVLLIR